MSADSQAQPKAHILLVEDDPAVRHGVKEYLLASGFETSEADTCAAAQVQFQTAPIDMAIVDYHLPDGNALQLWGTINNLTDEDPPLFGGATGGTNAIFYSTAGREYRMGVRVNF